MLSVCGGCGHELQAQVIEHLLVVNASVQENGQNRSLLYAQAYSPSAANGTLVKEFL